MFCAWCSQTGRIVDLWRKDLEKVSPIIAKSIASPDDPKQVGMFPDFAAVRFSLCLSPAACLFSLALDHARLHVFPRSTSCSGERHRICVSADNANS